MRYCRYLPKIPVLIILEEMYQSISLMWPVLVRTIKNESCSIWSCWQLYTKLIGEYKNDYQFSY